MIRGTMQIFKYWIKHTTRSMNKIISNRSYISRGLVMVRLKNPPKALGLFIWVGKQKDFCHTAQTYSAIIHILTRGKMFSKAEALMQEFIAFAEKHEMDPHTQVFNALNSAVNSLGHDSSCQVFDVLVTAYAQMGNVQEALDTIYRMQRSKRFRPMSMPMVRACNTLLSTLVKMERIDTVWVVYGDMTSSGLLHPNVYIYNTLINACCKEGRQVARGKQSV
ncbi:hypothetical protein SUGI_0730600 [Cryptomeria japonica]|nr:hypothetical protein SUGI_0730600 [Cryptomeria japonica]